MSRRVTTLASTKEDVRRIARFDYGDLLADIQLLLSKKTIGTADAPREVTLIDLAATKIVEHLPLTAPSAGGGDEKGSDGLSLERGGTRSVVEQEDQIEAAALAIQSLADADLLPQLLRQLKTATSSALAIPGLLDEIVRLMRRHTAKVDLSKLPKDGLPGCRSCARAGHFENVRETALKHGLCDWCYRHAAVSAREAGEEISVKFWPPEKACDIRHRQTEQAAGRWLAQHWKAA